MVAQKRALHILNGMEMYKHFKETYFLEPGWMIPFNEAMCYGNTCADIFSDNFIEIRAEVHHVSPAQYAEITLTPLQPLFHEEFSHIVLWFDQDMFCQMNLLTILAWLDQRNDQRIIDLHLVDDDFEAIEHFTIRSTGYYTIYKQVLINKIFPQNIQPIPLRVGIKRYLNYLKKDSDLMLYIQKHQGLAIEELVLQLIRNFKNYGLGDAQYFEIIKHYFHKD